MDQTAERRAHDRIPTRSLIEVRIPDWQTFQRVYSVNISTGGMRISLGRRVGVGTSIDVILTLPNGRRLHLPGQVVNVGGGPTGDIGVQFHPLSSRTRDEIEGYVQALRTGNLPPGGPPATGIPTGLLIKKRS